MLSLGDLHSRSAWLNDVIPHTFFTFQALQFYLLLHFLTHTQTQYFTHLLLFNTKIIVIFKKLKYKNIQNKKSDFKFPLSRGGTNCQACNRSGFVTQAQCHRSWVLWRLSEFALKENSWHTQTFFFIHRLTKHIFIHHFFITCVQKEPSQELWKTSRSTRVRVVAFHLLCGGVRRRTRRLRDFF